MSEQKVRSFWYRQQSSAAGQRKSTIKDVAKYFHYAGGPPRPGDRFRLDGEGVKAGYAHTVSEVDLKQHTFTFKLAGRVEALWLDWMIYEPQGPGQTEQVRRSRARTPNAPRKPRATGRTRPDSQKKKTTNVEPLPEDAADSSAWRTAPVDWVTNPRNSFDRWVVQRFREQGNKQ